MFANVFIHLGIENFNLGDDLEMANWVNEGLVKLSNRFKGKAQMPKNVILDEKYFIEKRSNVAKYLDIASRPKMTITFPSPLAGEHVCVAGLKQLNDFFVIVFKHKFRT